MRPSVPVWMAIVATACSSCAPSPKPDTDGDAQSPLTAEARNPPGEAPPFDEFRAWASNRAIAIDRLGFGTNLAPLEPLDSIIGSARVIAVSEPFHGAHEPLAFRNRLIEYLVTRHGLTAVALETGLSGSKALYDYVLGGPGDASAVV